jgi:hypothetical protein
MGQPQLLKKNEKSFAHLIAEARKVSTPGTPNFNIMIPTSENEEVSFDEQMEYRSAFGSLLQLIKYLRPDIAKNCEITIKASGQSYLRSIQGIE